MSTTLLIDAGNTRIKWAVAAHAAAPGVWIAAGAVLHTELDQLEHAWSVALFERALVANVAGAATRERLSRLLAGTPAAHHVHWFESVERLAGVRNAYRDAAQLGCDRFAAALGAHAIAPGQRMIVATCGTASTIDALGVEPDGAVFEGGMILPGLGLMAGSLARNTAQLPQITGRTPPLAKFADNTDDAIRSGCLNAQAGAIERAYTLHDAQTCIVSGGAARYISPLLSIPHQHIENIVLTGLSAAAAIVFQDRPC